MHRIILGLLLFGASSLVSANCYVGVSVGQSNLTKIPTKQNDRLLASEYVDGSYTKDGKSQTQSALIGCETPWDTAVELGYTTGIAASVETDARIVLPELTDRSIRFHVSQDATAYMYTISVIKFVRVWDPISVFGRLGVARTTVRLDTEIPFGNGYSLNHTRTKSLTSPYLGLGLAWRNDGPWSVRLEERMFAKQLRETSLTVVRAF